MYNKKTFILLCLMCYGMIAQAQKREDVYQQIDNLLSQGKWKDARAKAKAMAEDEDWSAIPLYQLVQTYQQELGEVSLADTAAHAKLTQEAGGYLAKMIELLPSKKSVKKDVGEYWATVVRDSTEELSEQQIVAKAMMKAREMQAGNELFAEEASKNLDMLAEMKRVYLICQAELLDFQAEHDNLARFYLMTTHEEKDSLRAVQQHGEKLKVMIKAYDKMWEGFKGLPKSKQQSFNWKKINPDAKNYYRFDEDKFRKPKVDVYDFSEWAGGLADKVHEVHHLAEQAELLYSRFDALEDWTQEDIDAAQKMIDGWKEQIKQYGSTVGTEHVLHTFIEKGKYLVQRAKFFEQDSRGYLHKGLRDGMIDQLIRKLDTLNGFASSIYPSVKSYAYQERFFKLLDKGGQPIALRDKIIEFSREERRELDFMKASSVHLPPEFPDSLIHNGKVVWLRPGKRNINDLYENGVYITEAIREGGGGVALKGRYKGSSGEMPFTAFVSIDGQAKWLKDYASDGQGTAIAPKFMEVDLQKRFFYYRKNTQGKYWLEAVDVNGKDLFRYELDALPVRQLFDKGQAIWVLWEQSRDNSGLVKYKAAQLDFTGNAMKEGNLSLEGSICSIIRYSKGIHVAGNYKRLIDWQGEEHKSEATRGYGTNVFVATLSTPELTRKRLIKSPISIFANAAMFNPEANQLRMLGYKGDFEILEETGKAKGISQWQEYINP